MSDDKPMNILYLGPNSGTTKHRADALARLGHHVEIINPAGFLPQNQLLAKLNWETGYVYMEGLVRQKVLERIGERRYDLTWVDSGHHVGPSLIAELKRRGSPVLNLNVDDPYGKRDRLLWSCYLKAVPAYDLIVVVRSENVLEAKARGAKKVMLVYRSADEIAHTPRVLTAEDHAQWDSEVAFVGTWMPERGPFMVKLLDAGVPLSIRGERWQKSPEWPKFKDVWKGPNTKTDDEYAKAIQCAKICLGLLSKGNRDLHTTRSLEVPYLGGLLCAERTPEHQTLYCEGEEAVFWADAEECAALCLKLLADEPRRREIARRGQVRCIENGTLNEPIMAKIIAEVPTL
jgi:spore maturation protein CgeB